MNRKNTIMIAVFINSGLLAALLIAALAREPENGGENRTVKEEYALLPKFEEPPLYPDPASFSLSEPPRGKEGEGMAESVLHKLPPLIVEPAPPIASSPPQTVPPNLPSFSVPSSSTGNEIVVKKGDHLEKIAKMHRTTVEEIIKLNQLPNTFLKIGQVLKIPSERGAGLPHSEKKGGEASAEYYTIKVGENPWAIAMKHHMKLDELLKLNGLNEEKARKLKPGDRLRIK